MSPTTISNATFSSSATMIKKQTVAHWVEQHTGLLNIMTLALVGILCLSYIFQVTSTVTKGYELRDLEVRIHELTLENQQMGIAIRQSQSLNHVANSVSMLGLVRSQQPTYIESGEPSYALAK
jgi:hypothetical protein